MNYAEFAKHAEIEAFQDFDLAQIKELMLLANEKALMYDRKLQSYLSGGVWQMLHNNLTLHYYIVSGIVDNDMPNASLYKKYSIADSSLPLSSVSNGGSSVSMINLKTFDNADLFFNDLWRTPYGKEAYQILESTKDLCVCIS